jgi:hypothetical protein
VQPPAAVLPQPDWQCNIAFAALPHPLLSFRPAPDNPAPLPLLAPLQPDLPKGTPCFVSGKPAKNWALWGRSY